MITKGQGPLGTIYERLRKRSLRKLGDVDSSLASVLGHTAHQYYTRGVRDALQAVELIGTDTDKETGD